MQIVHCSKWRMKNWAGSSLFSAESLLPCSCKVFVIPQLHRRWNGGILDSPRCLSVRPSISGTFWKITIGSIHFIPGIYPYGVSLLTPIHFRVPTLIFGPLVAKYLAKYLAENGVSGTFWKNYWLNSFHTWHLPLWGEFLDSYTFSCSNPHFRPSGGQIFGRKWGLLNFLKKNIGSIHFISGIYPYWVSLLTSIHFRVPSLIFGPLVTKDFAENGVSGTFWKKLLAQFISYLAFISGQTILLNDRSDRSKLLRSIIDRKANLRSIICRSFIIVKLIGLLLWKQYIIITLRLGIWDNSHLL